MTHTGNKLTNLNELKDITSHDNTIIVNSTTQISASEEPDQLNFSATGATSPTAEEGIPSLPSLKALYLDSL